MASTIYVSVTLVCVVGGGGWQQNHVVTVERMSFYLVVSSVRFSDFQVYQQRPHLHLSIWNSLSVHLAENRFSEYDDKYIHSIALQFILTEVSTVLPVGILSILSSQYGYYCV